MKSGFATPRRRIRASSVKVLDETYNLKGLNLTDPDEEMPEGESPWTTNSRMYARNDGEQRVSMRTRKGAGFFSTPYGETLGVQNIGSNTGDAPIGTELYVAQPFTPSTTNPYTKLDLRIKKAAGATGHVIVEIYANSGSLPASIIDAGGTPLAQGYIHASEITDSYQYLTPRFIDAPTLTSGTQYWILVYIQDNGGGTYYLSKTATTDQAFSTETGGQLWTALGYSINFKTYYAISGSVRGFSLRYPSDTSANRIIMAHRDKILAVPKNTGVPAVIDTITDGSSKVRFVQHNDKTIYVDGVAGSRYYDGTTAGAMTGSMPVGIPTNLIVHANRLFLLSSKNRVDFSALNDPNTFDPVNFFYVPAPLSPDPVTAWISFQSKLVIFTHETKHLILGSDISTFTRTEAEGTKGAVSQEAVAADRNYVYFMADDKQIYAFNGANDILLSEKVEAELQTISDVSKVRIDVYRNQVRVYYPKEPSATSNRCLIYDLILKQWFMDTGHPVVGSTNLYLDDNELIEFSPLVGQIFYGETQYSDMGKRIDFKWWSQYKIYLNKGTGGGSAKKRIKSFRPVLRAADSRYNLLVGKDMDFQNSPDMRNLLVSGSGARWGEFVWGDGTKWGGARQQSTRSGMSGRGRYIQYRFERNGVDTPTEIYGFIAKVKVGKQK